MNYFVKGSLIGTDKARKGQAGTGRFGMWNPPRLFNVYVKFGADTPPIKKLHLCTLDATVTAEGIIRRGIPDAYTVKFSFTSLLPDTLDAWPADSGFPVEHKTKLAGDDFRPPPVAQENHRPNPEARLGNFIKMGIYEDRDAVRTKWQQEMQPPQQEQGE